MSRFTSGRALARALYKDIQIIEKTAAQAAEWNRTSRLLPQEIEWLLDNRYVCRREGEEARTALRGAKRLPSEGTLPAVYTLAADFAERSGELTEAGIGRYLKEKQAVRPLYEREIWLFTAMLRAAVISRVAQCCREIGGILDAYRKTGGDSPFTAEARAFALRQAGRVPDRGTEEFAEAAEGAHRRNAETIGGLIASLRFLSTADLTETLQNAGALETALRRDPLYEQMDEETRGAYRRRLARLAQKAGISESEAAETVLSLCAEAEDEKGRHVGTYLWDRPLGKEPSRVPGLLYFCSFAILTFIPSAVFDYLTGHLWAGLLLLLPLAAMAKNITDAAATKLAPCRPVPRLELPDGIPEEGKTLCVVSVLLSGGQKGAEFAKKLEGYRLANRDAGENLLFGLLADLPDSAQKTRPTDERVMSMAQQAVFALNRKYGGGFFLFTRDREWNVRDKTFMVWERKRGALIELCRLLRGGSGAMRVAGGDKAALKGVRFLLTLDGDTALTPGSARRMAGAMLHPVNRPETDPVKRVVISGHGVLAPRMAVDLEAAGKSVFSRVFAGQGGLDPYSGAAGEVYHDLFGQGSFHGKGIFDVDVYLECLDGRLPENRILSHDLLEGAYLRAGLMEDIELTDGFPSTARAWFLRQHRWIRGDWQAAAWAFKKDLPPLSRWKLFDPLRSSLTPVAALAALTAGTLLPGRVFGLILAAALTASASHLLLSFAERAAKPGRPGRTHAAIITGVPAVLSQTLLNLAFLPYNAVISAHAAVLALWRMCVSRRNLLQWTTSAETENVFAGAAQTARNMFPGLAWGVFTALLSRSAVGWVLGLGWAASPFIAYAVSKTNRAAEKLSDADRAFLLRQAALMWQYFEDFLLPEDHYLIPDNFQEQPAAGVAYRTSPTNIGLSLLCALAAADLGVCAREKALVMIEGILRTMEDLPKWNGHLLNWYDTRTLEPLPPRCVSSVDSGNLCGCLIALREGLGEFEDEKAAALAERAGELAGGMDFRPLYDGKRRLFHISTDLDDPERKSGVYDLLASEARQTSFIAVARGEVDKKHWQRLGRAQTALGRYRGMASWTGTMFEYFMPHLLLPAYRNSLLKESLDFAVYAQRAQAARRGGPWGVSESCFYAFDRSLNYQYKAHGVPSLAYKRGLGADHVVSPYSGYLSLLTHPSASVRNLRRIHRLGAEGRYGLIEALDFTPARVTAPFAQVRCYMSHHLGMSIVAVCNALRENVMQKRFMRDAAMGAFAGLLQERVPVGAAAVRPSGREVPEKPKRAEGTEFSLEVERVCKNAPKAALLGNASYTVLCADNGLTRSQCGGDTLTLGMDFYVNGLKFIPESASFTGTDAVWRGSAGGLAAETLVSVPDNENAELRVVTLRNTGSRTAEGMLSCFFEPVLQRSADYAAHPAFSKLFIDTRVEDGLCLARRRPRAGRGELWLAFACGGEVVGYETRREAVVGRGTEPRAVLPKGPKTADVPIDPCVYAALPIELAPGEKTTVRFSLSCAASARDAASAARRTLRRTEGSPLPDETALALGLTPSERGEAFEWLAGMVFPEGERGLRERLARPRPELAPGGLALGRNGLWSAGISGDLPLLLTAAVDSAEWEKAARVVRQHRWLSLCGHRCDLAILLRDGGDYRRPARTLLMETLKACRAEHTAGRKGGVHAVDIETLAPGQEALLRAFASAAVPCVGQPPERAAGPDGETQPPPRAVSAPLQNPGPVKYRWEADGAFRFEVRGELPPLTWSHTLANRNFSALVTETGGGYIAFQNARENKYTPWSNDPLAIDGGIRLTAALKDGITGLFASGDGLPCDITYGFGYARWEKRAGEVTLTTTQFVPPERNALVTMIEISGGGAAVTLETTPVMGVSAADGRLCVVTADEDGGVRVQNPFNTAYAPQTFVIFPGLTLEARERAVLVMGAARSERGVELLRELTRWEAAEAALQRTCQYWEKAVRPVEIKSGRPALDHYGNGWALYQIIAVRLYARASQYQCGGAYGFRDQLQDACAALLSEPRHAKAQILRACSRQYEEGDVMHWWHPSRREWGFSDKGVRTRCSDDLLWLPYTAAEYMEKTGDTSLMELETAYLSSPPLEEGKDDRYESAAVTERRGSVHEHCLRAFEKVTGRGVGANGLLLIGAGDWNDGMNLVGHKGRGESVWLTWFAAHTAERYAQVCISLADMKNAEKLKSWADGLVASAASAWDGEWFLRGYYDDGSTLGSKDDEECRIDSIAQSFSALFGDRVPKERVGTALESASERLIDREAGLIRLFDPPFSGRGAKDPGYIKGYVPGVRENGGQYTHAAVWLAMAFLKTGGRERCLELLEMILPETHDSRVYKAEPHVLAADIYSHPAHLGRGGWSQYTGAAAWFYRVLLEALDLGEGNGI